MAHQPNTPLEESENAEKLIALFQAVAAAISLALLSPNAADNLEELLAQADDQLIALLAQATSFSQTEIVNRYAQGLTGASRIISDAGIKLIPPNRAAHNTVAQSMATELVDDFAKGIIAVQDGITSAVSQSQRRRILSRFGSGLREEQGEKIREILSEQGTKGLLDRGGKRWDITTYARMLVKTKEREALNSGMLARAQEIGISVFRVNFTGSKHKECIRWQNQHVSVSGEFGLPTIDDATSAGLFHPNCLTYGTELLTSKGTKKIGEIRDGATVIDMRGVPTKVITNVVRDYRGPVHTISSNSFEVSGTPDHACLTKHGWTRFEDVREGDAILQNIPNIGEVGIDSVVSDTEHDEALRIQKLVASNIFSDLVRICVTSSVDLNNEEVINKKVYDIPFNRLLKRVDNSTLFHPSDDSRFILVGIRTETIRQAIRTFNTNGLEIGIPTIINEMLHRTSAWNTELIHRINDTGSTLKSTQFGNLLEAHTLFIVDPLQEGADIAMLLFDLCKVRHTSVKNVSSKVQNTKVYDIQTNGTYLLASGIVSHNCLHRLFADPLEQRKLEAEE